MVAWAGTVRSPVGGERSVIGWVAVQVLGTVGFAVVLATTHQSDPLVWSGYGLSAACWLGFVLAEARLPRTSTCSLAGSVLLACTLVAPAGTDNTAVILAFIALGRFASLVRASLPAIVAVTATSVLATTLGSLLAGLGVVPLLVTPAMLVLAMVLGLHPRQYQVRAHQAALLLEQTRRAQEEHTRAAALDERARIAREIHDVLAHSLGGLGVQLELAEALLADHADSEGGLAALRRSRRLASDGVTEAREAVAALRKDVPPLPDALAELAQTHRRDHGVCVRLVTDGDERPLPARSAVALVAATREALTNAARHGARNTVEIVIEFADEVVRVRVCNAVSEVGQERDGFGLSGMRERLALVGGTLTAGPQHQQWHVTAEVPG